MAARLSIDTTLLIDLQRERARRRGPRPAHRFLEDHADASLAISAVALGEFAEGFEDADHPLVRLVRATHELLPVDAEVALRYAAVTRRLRGSGQLIGANDLWIAATALRHGLPLVTSNEEPFARVPGLVITAYRS